MTKSLIDLAIEHQKIKHKKAEKPIKQSQPTLSPDFDDSSLPPKTPEIINKPKNDWSQAEKMLWASLVSNAQNLKDAIDAKEFFRKQITDGVSSYSYDKMAVPTMGLINKISNTLFTQATKAFNLGLINFDPSGEDAEQVTRNLFAIFQSIEFEKADYSKYEYDREGMEKLQVSD